MPTILERTSFTIGETAKLQHKISRDEIVQFANLTGDKNPVHLDRKYAQTTIFKDCIAHGMFVVSLISKALGMQLPGPGAIYLNQSVNFLKPVYVGDILTVEVEITEWNSSNGRLTLSTSVYKQDHTRALTGEAKWSWLHF